MTKKPAFVYGKSPNPRNWHETADVLKALSRPPQKSSSGLKDQLAAIERMLKEKK